MFEIFADPGTLQIDHRKYLIIIEHVWVWLIFSFNFDPENIPLLTKKVKNLSYITQLVRYKRESLSIIACLLINILITNNPELIPGFLQAEMIGDLIYGVKSNPRIGSEVMSILSLISSIKRKVQESCDNKEWNQIADKCIYGLITDPRILALISDSMKLKHITVINPLLTLLGNVMSATESGIESELVKVPQFKEMLDFWFRSESGVLQRQAFWVIGNMICCNDSEVTDYFIMEIDILATIMTKFINHEDVIVQREACYALFYCLSQSRKRSTRMFNNQYRWVWVLCLLFIVLLSS